MRIIYLAAVMMGTSRGTDVSLEEWTQRKRPEFSERVTMVSEGIDIFKAQIFRETWNSEISSTLGPSPNQCFANHDPVVQFQTTGELNDSGHYVNIRKDLTGEYSILSDNYIDNLISFRVKNAVSDPDLFYPGALLEHDDVSCRYVLRSSQYEYLTEFGKRTLVGKKFKIFLIKTLLLFRKVHSIGLLLNIDRVLYDGDSEKFEFRIPGPEWEFFLTDPRTGEHSLYSSRVVDLKRFAIFLRNEFSFKINQHMGLGEALNIFESNIDALGWFDAPNYDELLSSFETVHFVPLSDVLDNHQTIQQDSWICKALESAESLIDWLDAGHKSLSEIIMNLGSRIDIWLMDCRMGIIQGYFYSMILLRGSQEGYMDLQSHGRPEFCDLLSFDVLSNSYKKFMDRKSLEIRLLFSWTVCPLQFLPVLLKDKRYREPLLDDIYSIDPIANPSIIDLFWEPMKLPAVWDLTHDEIVLLYAAKLVRGTKDLESKFPGVSKFCYEPEMILDGIRKFGVMEGHLRLANFCHLSETELCQVVQEKSLDGILSNADGDKRSWNDGIVQSLIELASEVVDEDCRAFLVTRITNAIMRLTENSQSILLADLRKDYFGIDTFCSLNAIEYLEGYRLWFAGRIFFVCHHDPVEQFCQVLDQFRRNHSGFLYVFRDWKYSEHAWIHDIHETGLLKSVSLADETCKPTIVEYLGVMIKFAREEFGLSVFEIQNGARIDSYIQFCVEHEELLVSIQTTHPDLSYICNNLPPPPVEHLYDLFAEVKLIDPISRLDVHRKTSLSDSISLLCSPFADNYFPTSVYFTGEVGIDARGFTRDWFTQAAQIASSPVEEDPAGDLFIKEPEKEYLVVNVAKLPLTDDTKKHYQAFGRLMAIAFIKNEQLGIPLPTFFFAKFLNGVITHDDLYPEEQEKARELEKGLRDFMAETAYRSRRNKEPYELLNMYEGLENIDEEILTADNVESVLSRVPNTFMSISTDVIIEEIRTGFSHYIPIDAVRERFAPYHFKLLISGDEKLDVGALKLKSVKYETLEAYPERVTDDSFNYLFDWLSTQTTSVHRRFMRFVTGSSSLSAREIKVSGPDSEEQGLFPLAHTCFNRIALPKYSSPGELSRYMSEAILNDVFGGVEG